MQLGFVWNILLTVFSKSISFLARLCGLRKGYYRMSPIAEKCGALVISLELLLSSAFSAWEVLQSSESTPFGLGHPIPSTLCAFCALRSVESHCVIDDIHIMASCHRN